MSSPTTSAPPPEKNSQVIPIVVVVVLAAVIIIIIVIYCVVKKCCKKGDKKPSNDGGVEEELIQGKVTHNNHAEPDLDQDKPGELVSGPRPHATRNQTNKKWYDSKAIPFMDEKGMSVENLDAV